MDCFHRGAWLVAWVAVHLTAVGAHAGDWPQLLGPNRNGIAVDERIASAWPDRGPTTLWQRSVGSGFAGVSVQRGVAVLFHRLGDQEVVEALDAGTGKRLWKSTFPASYRPSYCSDNGPRVVPVIARGRVYVYGAMGNLRCLALDTGSTAWERDAYGEFNSKEYFHGEPPEGYFGVATSPIVEGDRILMNVGGDTRGAGIVAFAADTGRTLWKATNERAGYSSPVAVTVGGKRHVIFVTRLNVVSIDPESGGVRFAFPFGRVGPTVNAANPVVFDNHVFVTASYRIGSVLAKLKPDGADVLWRDGEILASQYTTCIEHEGCLFGVDGRQDGPPAHLTCFDPITRRVRWTQPSYGYATLLKADGKLIILKTDGVLVLAAADTTQYDELARARISQATTRAAPALADGLLYVRDTSVLRCIDLRPQDASRDD